MQIYLYLLCLLLWATAGNGQSLLESQLPSTDQCGRIDEVFPPGYSYSFTYNLTKPKFANESPDDHYLRILCDIELQAFSTCNYVLHTKNCKLYKTPTDLHEKSSLFSKQMENYAVPLNGYESISANVKEETALLNIKRGIISTIYSASVYLSKGRTTTIAKPDLQGICNVTYNSFQQDGQIVIRSNKGFPSWFHEEESCIARFDENTKFDRISCNEVFRHIPGVIIDTKFTRELKLKHRSRFPGIKANYMSTYKLTNLTYEKPIAFKSPHLQKSIIQQIRDLASFSDNPIESQTVWTFNLLVENLKVTSNIANIGRDFDNCWDSTSCSKENQIRVGHIWRDALIRCDRADCIREFKYFVKKYTSIFPDILNDAIMHDIYLSWFEGSTDPMLIEDIHEICEFRNQTVCYLSVAAKIHHYWTNSKKLLTASSAINNIVKRVIEPIKQCRTLQSSDYKVLRSLQMLSNIGEIAKIVDGNIVDLVHECAISSSADWAISLAAVEALDKFEGDNQLYQYLLDIIKNPSLSQKHHVVGYHILIDKYAEKAAADVLLILRSNNTDGNFKTYIYSHVKAVLKAQDYSKRELTKAFRKIVDSDPSEFFSYNSNGKFVSKYVEENLYYIQTLSKKSATVYGIEDHLSFINDGSSFIPSSAIEKVKFIFQGKKFDIGKLAIYTKGLIGVLTSTLEKYSKGSGNFMEPIMRFGHPDNRLNDLLSKIDKNVADKLQTIVSAIPTHVTASLLAEYDILGDKVWYGNAEYPPWTFNFLIPYLIPQTTSLYRKHSRLFKIKETEITTSGLPLQFLIEAESIVTSKHGKDFKNDYNQNRLTLDLSLSAAAILRVAYASELPGYERFGISYEAIGSASCNLRGLYNENASKRTTSYRLDLPENSKQALNLALEKVSWTDNKYTPFPKSSDNTQKRCTKLSGTSFCKTDYYESPQFSSTMEIFTPVDYPVSLHLETSNFIQNESNLIWNGHTWTFGIFASEGYAKALDVVRVKHLFNEERDYRDIDIDSDVLPGFKLAIDLQKVRTDNATINISSTLFPGFAFDYYYREFTSKYSETSKYGTQYLLDKRINRRGETAHYKMDTFNFVSPFGILTSSSSEQQYPVTYYADATMQIELVNEAIWEQYVARTFPILAMSEDSKIMKWDIHFETDDFLSNIIHTIPERSAELTISFPTYSIEAKYDKSLLDDLSAYSTLNITSKTLPDEKVDVSYRFSLHKKTSDESDHSKVLTVASFSIPYLLWRFTCEENFYKVDKYSHKWKLERLVNSKDIVHEANSPFYLPMRMSPPSHNEINFSFVNDSTASSGSSAIDINLGSKGIIDRNIHLHFDVVSRAPTHVKYTIDFSDYNRILRGIHRHHEDPFTIENDMILVDNNNKTIFIQTHDLKLNLQGKNIKYNSNFDSEVYSSKEHLKWDFSDEYSAFDLNVSSYSPVWDFATFDLKSYKSGDTSQLNLKHSWADVDLDTSVVKKNQKTLSINGKIDLIPTSRWTKECESEHYCVVVSNFRDKSYSKIYIIYEVSSGATEETLTICKDKICQDPETDPDSLVVKSIAGLIDHDTVVHTVVSNPFLIAKGHPIIAGWSFSLANKISLMFDPQHPIHQIYKYFVGRSLAESKERAYVVAMEISQILVIDLTVTFMPPVSPIIGIVSAAKSSRRSERSESASALNIIGGDHWISTIPATSQGWVNRVGPFLAFSKVYEMRYIFPFINITTFDFQSPQAMIKYLFETKGEGDVQNDNFYDEDYSRVALVIGPNIVRPFEGGLFTIENSDCPQLLTYDIENKHFVVYKESNWIYFVFSDTILKLSYNSGEFYVNSKPSEFPYENPEMKITVERQNNLVYVTTDYHLEVACDINDYFCVFYTDFWKFGKFHGLLGRNIDVVDALKRYGTIDDPYNFLLTEDSSCKRSNSKFTAQTADSNERCKDFFELATVSAVWHKYDKINPKRYYEECINQPQYYKSIIGAYIAAAAALRVPVDFDYPTNSLCGNHHYGDEWKGKWEQTKLDVVFVVDLSLNPDLSETYSKSLSKLATQIKQDFERASYSDIKFSLYGFRGNLEGPFQFTMNEQVWGTAEQFSNHGLKHLFSLSNETKPFHNSSEVFDAIAHALAVNHFTDSAVRMMILVTANDKFDHIKVKDLYNTLTYLNDEHVSLYSISNYKELPSNAYGITGADDNDRYIPSNNKAKILKGHAARLVKATNGASWSLHYLENEKNQKEFLSAVSSAMVSRGKDYLNSDIHYYCGISPMGFAYPYVSFE